jgi:3-hydroxyisobutyrate dehydrogenase-like beta-hydroxyacid dehydrogenase
VTSVGVIGLGDIGQGIAANVHAGGFSLAVCDLAEPAMQPFADTARLTSSAAELAQGCDVVIVAVVNDAQVLSVMNGEQGVLTGASRGTVALIVSTISVATVLEVAEQAKAFGVEVLDCGVSGGPAAAKDGDLAAMIGGDAEVVEKIRPVLDSFSSLVVHMGPLGSGLKAKLARNLVQYGSWLAAYEGQRLAEAAGIELSKLAAVIRSSDKRIGGAATLMFRTTVAPFTEADDAGLVNAMRAAANLAHKDLTAALELAGELKLDLPLAELTDAQCGGIFGVGPDDATRP